MIAVDELPLSVSIRGVPRVLTQSDLEGMRSVGPVNPSAHVYVVDVPSGSTNGSGQLFSVHHQPLNNTELNNSLMRILLDDKMPVNQRMAVLHTLIQQAAASQNLNPMLTAVGSRFSESAHASGSRTNTGKQVILRQFHDILGERDC